MSLSPSQSGANIVGHSLSRVWSLGGAESHGAALAALQMPNSFAFPKLDSGRAEIRHESQFKLSPSSAPPIHAPLPFFFCLHLPPPPLIP